MYLVNTCVEEFKAFEQASIDIPASGVTLIAGPNNSGKTALLSALDVIAGRGTIGVPQRAGSQKGLAINATFLLVTAERERLLAGVSDPGPFLARGVFERITFWFEQLPGGAISPVRITGSWAADQEISVVANVRDPSGSFALHSFRLLSDSPDRQPDMTHAWGTGGGLIGIELNNAGSGRPAMEFLQEWREAFYHFYALRQGTSWHRQMNTARRLTPTGEDLPDVLSYLMHNQEPIWRRLQNLIAQVVPEIGTLSLPTDGNQMEVAFKDPQLPDYYHNLKSLGTGVEQLLLTLVVGLTHPEPSTVVLEEPETGLHPGAQRALLSLLQEWSHKRAFVVSSHSAAMLDWTRPERIYVVSRARGVSTVVSAAADPTAILLELGVRLSDVLSAEGILLLEGDTDRKVLETWFPDAMLNPKLAVIPGGGGENVRLAHILEAWLSQADTLTRKILYIRDRDELPSDLIARLERSETVQVLQRRELENYLFDIPAVCEVVNSYRPGSDPATLDDVKAALKESADDLRNKVVIGRVCAQIGIVRLADQSLRESLVQQRATVEQLESAVLGELPERDELAARIRDLWTDEETAVEAAWPDHWEELAPGADVLDGAFRRLAARGYGKGSDGPAIAGRMQEAPLEIRDAILGLLAPNVEVTRESISSQDGGG